MFDALTSTKQTISVNGNGTAIKVDKSNDVDVTLVIENVTGTLPTLDISFEVSKNGADYTKIGSVPQITTAGVNKGVIKFNLEDYTFIRPVYVVGGTTPSFDVTLKLN